VDIGDVNVLLTNLGWLVALAQALVKMPETTDRPRRVYTGSAADQMGELGSRRPTASA
jgi:hypothetical protein